MANPPGFSRRRFIIGSAAGISLMPLSYILSVSFGGYQMRTGFKILTSKEVAIAEAIGETIIPNQNEVGINIHDMEFAKALDEMLTILKPYQRSNLKLLLFLTEHLLPLRCFYFKKFTKLSIAKRTHIVDKFEASKAVGNRAFARLFKSLVFGLYYNDQRVLARIGYDWNCQT